MKKIYFLALLCCLGFSVFAQTTVDIFSTGASGSYTTGTAVNLGGGTYFRQDGNIGASTTPVAAGGYGVFNLSSIPAGATITSCLIGFTVGTVTGTPTGCATYGYPGNLSTVTVAATLFADLTAGTLLSGVTYAATASNQVLPSTAASQAFIQSNIGNIVSICWTGGGAGRVGIVGETGAASTSGGAPYLQITYCFGATGVSASATPNPLCPGAALTLNGTATGASGYSWAGPGGFTSALQNPTTTAPTSMSVYTLTAYTASGCATEATTTVSLNPTPAGVITGSPLLFCQGQAVLLGATSGAGYTYQWYNGGAAISGATNQTYNDSTNGNFTVKITNTADGCTDLTAATIVSVLPHDPLLNPAGNTDVCVGSNLTLAVDLTGIVTTGVTYQWLDNNIAIAGATLPTYTTSTSGIYNCILTTAVCNDTTQSTDLTISLLPNPPISYNSGVLSTSSAYTSYQWFLNLVAVTGATSHTLVATNDGSYRVRVTDVNGCTNYSDPYDLYDLGVTKVNNAGITIYPNPADKNVHINSALAVRAVISTIEGKKLMDVAAATDIDVNELPGGIYLIMLYNDAGERLLVDKLIKN